MTKRQQDIALLALGWSFRRIERETKVRRETVSRYARPADPNGGYEETIREKLGHGLTAQRIWQDLVEPW